VEDNGMTMTHVLLLAILISNVGIGFLIYALGKVLLEKKT
jgi:hypothetical protein